MNDQMAKEIRAELDEIKDGMVRMRRAVLSTVTPGAIDVGSSGVEGPAAYPPTDGGVMVLMSGYGAPLVIGGVACRVYRDTNQSIADGSDVAISFSDERFDYGGFWDPGQPTRLTAPVAGLYLIWGNVNWDADADGSRLATIRLNGTDSIGRTREPAIGASTDVPMQVVTPYELAAGDYVELVVRQASGGGALSVTTNAQYSPEFAMARIF